MEILRTHFFGFNEILHPVFDWLRQLVLLQCGGENKSYILFGKLVIHKLLGHKNSGAVSMGSWESIIFEQWVPEPISF